MCTQSVIIKKEENVGTYFDDDICEAFHLELYHTTISRVLHDQDFPKRVDMMCFVIVKYHVKSLDAHTHIIDL